MNFHHGDTESTENTQSNFLLNTFRFSVIRHLRVLRASVVDSTMKYMNANKMILTALGDPLPIVSAPFRHAARRAGMKEQSLLALLRRGKKEGIIRRIGAVLEHRKIGLKANALVAWNVPKERLREAGRNLSRYPQVSHCYARRISSTWPYRLYTMVHARSKIGCLALVRKMAHSSRVPDYQVFFTLKELKKEKMNFVEVF